MKSHETVEMLRHNIRFKPAFYILDLLVEGKKITGKRFGLSKAETTHCIFDDLRYLKLIKNIQRSLKIDIPGSNICERHEEFKHRHLRPRKQIKNKTTRLKYVDPPL